MKFLTTIFMLLTLAACSTPVTQIQSVDLRPTLSISNAPQGSVLSIDGVIVGDAGSIAKGNQAIKLSPGTHQINASHNGNILINEKVYLGEGLHKTLSAGVAQ